MFYIFLPTSISKVFDFYLKRVYTEQVFNIEVYILQVLKDEIRDKILTAAIGEFYDKGYKDTVMRSIAERAGVPTGLIYSYYKNKEALFRAVVSPVLYDWEHILSTSHDNQSELIYGLSKAESDCLLNMFDHREQSIILFDKSEGTKYEYEKECLVQNIEKHLFKHKLDNEIDEVYFHIIANNFVDGLMQIMYHYQGKEWAIMLLRKLSKMYNAGIGW